MNTQKTAGEQFPPNVRAALTANPMTVEVSMARSRHIVLVNDDGHVIGEDHHRAKLSNAEVDRIVALRADGVPCKVVAEQFEVSASTVESIWLGRRRAQIAMGQKRRAKPYVSPTGKRRGGWEG